MVSKASLPMIGHASGVKLLALQHGKIRRLLCTSTHLTAKMKDAPAIEAASILLSESAMSLPEVSATTEKLGHVGATKTLSSNQ